MNDALKKTLIFGGIVLSVWWFNKYIIPKRDNIYTIELNSEPYTICGKDIYISNFTYNNELNLSELIDSIEYNCNYYK